MTLDSKTIEIVLPLLCIPFFGMAYTVEIKPLYCDLMLYTTQYSLFYNYYGPHFNRKFLILVVYLKGGQCI